jgi:hypothetical protein
MSPYKTAIASLCLLLLSAGSGWAVTAAPPTTSKETTEEEAKERLNSPLTAPKKRSLPVPISTSFRPSPPLRPEAEKNHGPW